MSEDQQKRIAELGRRLAERIKGIDEASGSLPPDLVAAAKGMLSLTAPPKPKTRGESLALDKWTLIDDMDGPCISFDSHLLSPESFFKDCATSQRRHLEAVRERFAALINAERADAARAMRDRCVAECRKLASMVTHEAPDRAAAYAIAANVLSKEEVTP